MAILIHETLEQHIVHVHRINHRIMKITLHSERSHTPLTIINTYAPHQGKTKVEQQEHWKRVKEIVANTPRKHLTLWRAGANGQMGKLREGEETPQRIIGPYTKGRKAEIGNGRAISNICSQEIMMPMKTWKKHPWQKKKKRNHAKYPSGGTKTHIEQNNINTWTSPDGQTRRQIDYIVINHNYRNSVTRAWADQSWRGNMTQQRQHATIRLDVTLRLVRNYHKKPPPETGTNIKYDLEAIRKEPAKLAKWYQEQEQKQNETENWGTNQKLIQQGLQQCYPQTPQTQKKQPRTT